MNIFSYRSPLVSTSHSITLNPNPNEFDMHAHDRMEIFMLIQGNVIFGTEGTEQPLQPYDIVITREAETHKLIVDPNVPYERIWIQFSKDLLAPIDPDHSLLDLFYNRPLGKENFYPANDNDQFRFKCISKLCQDKRDIPYQLHLTTYLIPLLRELTVARNATTPINNNEPDDIALQLVAFINDHLFSPLSLDRLSEKFFLSKSQLNRIFLKATGATIARYISIKRMLTARQMIRDGIPIHEVSARCGYNDYSTFFRAYKNHFDIAPADDKKQSDL